MTVDGRNFRVMPEDDFVFNRGHLLVEYEFTKRPVESVSKYWWLFCRSDWPELRRPIALVLLLLDDYGNRIRRESVELLGNELQNRFSELFRFWFVPPESVTASEIGRVIPVAAECLL